MKLFVVPIATGLLCGFLAAFLWALLWTVVIPWPAHETFYTIVFALVGFGAGVLTLNRMLRGVG